MLNHKKFDLWEDEQNIINIEFPTTNKEYLITGYKEVLNLIYNDIRNNRGKKILDLGIGSKTLFKKLYNDGYEMWGIDINLEKDELENLNLNMPEAKFRNYNLEKEIPSELKRQNFDYIISSYSMHNIGNKDKLFLIENFLEILDEDGIILIGDVSFEHEKDLIECKEKYINLWDFNEAYIVYEELHQKFKNMFTSYRQVSHCSGIIKIEKDYKKETREFKELYKEAKNLARPRKYGRTIKSGEVAAIILTDSGKVFKGISVKSDTGLDLCAEHVAILSMLTKGETKIKKILVADSRGEIHSICNNCKKILLEINKENINAKIVIDKSKSKKLKNL